MSSPIRRLVAQDQQRHGAAAAPSATDSAPEADNPTLDFFADLSGDAAADAPSDPAPLSPGDAFVDSNDPGPEQGVDSPNDPADVAVPAAPAPAVMRSAPAGPVTPRPQVVDVLTSLCPVFRAAHVFPGTAVPAKQLAEAVATMSRQVVMLSHALSHDADPLEIDQTWMRARMGTFVAELVANAWISASIARERTPGQHAAPEADMERLAASVDAALAVVSQEAAIAGSASRAAAVVGLVPLVYHLEQYAHFVRRALPSVELDLDGACARIGAALAAEVDAAVDVLAPLVPETVRYELASELMAHGGKFAFDARESACSEVFAALEAIRDRQGSEEEAVALMTGEQMQGGVPVARTIELMTTMFRRAVSTIEYSARSMLGEAA